MRCSFLAIVGALLLVALSAAGCGADPGGCTPPCRTGYVCFFGTCTSAPDVVDDGGGDHVVTDDGAGETVDVPRDVPFDAPTDGGCTSEEQCFDGDPCTQDVCDTSGGRCLHPPALEGTPCAPDGERCTLDVCDGGGVCAHPANPECCGSNEDCNDGNPCTDDTCYDGTCSWDVRPDCCTRDGDCISPDRIGECDPGTGTCYDPPAGEVCATCSSHTGCGDGGSASDDWCVFYTGYSEAGCSKDCIDDYDCPPATFCSLDGSPCEGRGGCYCVSRLGSCIAYNRFGQGCGTDAECRAGCSTCGDVVCRAGYCTWPCGSDLDCRFGSWCDPTDYTCHRLAGG